MKEDRVMDFQDMVRKSRSYRRFDAGHAIAGETLRGLIGLARISPSAANRQPLKFVLSSSPRWNATIFEHISWAGYLPEWGGPQPAERPTAYIVILVDKTVSQAADVDVGIAAQTILLGAVEKGLGGCMFGAVKRGELAKALGLQDNLAIALVIALGKPVERVVLEDLPEGGSIKYYREADGTHHVPKRKLEELVVASYG
jgi:nitroreductase